MKVLFHVCKMKLSKFDSISKQVDLKNSYSHFFTQGRWSSFELLLYLLTLTKKADIIITSFSISDEFLRFLEKAKKENLINSITGIFNVAILKYKIDLLQFASKIFDKIYIGNTHKKIFLIKNERFNITVNQSANCTYNNQSESGIICTVPEIYILYEKNINIILEKSKILKVDEFSRRQIKRD